MADRHLLEAHQEAYPWLDTLKSELDASARDLDAATLSRLNRARQAALAQVSPPDRRPSLILALASITGIALAVFLGPALWPVAPVKPASVSVEASIEDFELLSSDANLALYSELDFYVWLESQELDG